MECREIGGKVHLISPKLNCESVQASATSAARHGGIKRMEAKTEHIPCSREPVRIAHCKVVALNAVTAVWDHPEQHFYLSVCRPALVR